MFSLLRRSALLFSLPMLSPADPPGDPNPNPDPKPDDVKFDEAQQKKLNDLLAAERKTTEDRVKAALAAEAEANKTKAEEEKAREEATKRGEFDKVRLDLEGKVQTTEAERDRIKAENDSYAALFEKQYAADVKEIPEKIWKIVKPADDAPLAERIEALNKAKELAGVVGGSTPRGSGPLPRPGETKIDIDEQVEKAKKNTAYQF